MTPASDGRFSISQCFSTDGLRRSAFDSTPLRVKPTEPEKSSMTVSYGILRGGQRIGAVSESDW